MKTSQHECLRRGFYGFPRLAKLLKSVAFLPLPATQERGEDRGEGILRESVVAVGLGVNEPPSDALDLVVISPGVPVRSALVQGLLRRNLPVIGELELGYQQSLCLNISITGTNGKTTTAELVEQTLTN